MYDPRFRMAMLISMMVCGYALFQVIVEYIFGERAFNLQDYLQGVGGVTGAALGGFLFVTLCTKFITFNRFKVTGFEPAYTDEAGTGFNFPVSLSKFLPDVIAAPEGDELSPVEKEIIGFLNGFRDWPADISGEDKTNFYDFAMTRWRMMRTLPNATELHYIAALSQHLSKIYAAQETRRSAPLWKFWVRDKVKFKRRCLEHGGLSAFILSTFPSFLRMEERRRRAVLIAVRYRDNPIQIPANCDPMAMDIYESLHRVEQLVEQSAGDNVENFNPSEHDLEQLKGEIAAFFQSIIRALELNPIGQSAKSVGIYLGDGLIVLRMGRLVRAFAPVLSPDIRNAFHMWSLDGKPHPSWKGFLAGFRELGVLEETFNNISATGGLFGMRIGDLDYANSIVLRVDITRFTDLRQSLDSLPRFNGIVDVVQSDESLLQEINEKSAKVDALLAQMRAAV